MGLHQRPRYQRHQLLNKLLHEQPHLRVDTGEFRERFVLRATYVVGPDAGTLANYCGYARLFVVAVQRKYHKEAVKAMRGWVEGYDYEKSLLESIKEVGHTIARVFEKRSARKRMSEWGKKLFGGRKVQGPYGTGRRTEARATR